MKGYEIVISADFNILNWSSDFNTSIFLTGSAAWVQARCPPEPDAGESREMGRTPLASIFCWRWGLDDVSQGSKVRKLKM